MKNTNDKFQALADCAYCAEGQEDIQAIHAILDHMEAIYPKPADPATDFEAYSLNRAVQVLRKGIDVLVEDTERKVLGRVEDNIKTLICREG